MNLLKEACVYKQGKRPKVRSEFSLIQKPIRFALIERMACQPTCPAIAPVRWRKPQERKSFCEGGWRRQARWRFTLIELLVVVAIIGILAAMLLPVLAKARERARRVVCMNNQRQFSIALTSYADENEGALLYGVEDLGFHTVIRVGSAAKEAFDPHIGDWTVTNCPNYLDTNTIGSGDPGTVHGYRLGIFYMGGLDSSKFAGGINPWTSPNSIKDDPSLVLLADMTIQGKAGRFFTRYPHTAGGWYKSEDKASGGVAPRSVALDGANVALLDGSVSWRTLANMLPHSAHSGFMDNPYWW